MIGSWSLLAYTGEHLCIECTKNVYKVQYSDLARISLWSQQGCGNEKACGVCRPPMNSKIQTSLQFFLHRMFYSYDLHMVTWNDHRQLCLQNTVPWQRYNKATEGATKITPTSSLDLSDRKDPLLSHIYLQAILTSSLALFRPLYQSPVNNYRDLKRAS